MTMKNNILLILLFGLITSYLANAQNQYQYDKMREAIAENSITKVTQLINNGADINYVINESYLYYAVMCNSELTGYKYKGMIYHLLSLGADPEIMTKDGDKPSWLSYRSGQYQLAKEITNYGNKKANTYNPQLVINKKNICEINSISFSTDGNRVAIGTSCNIIIIDLVKGYILNTIRIPAQTVCYLPSSYWFASSHYDEIDIWDGESAIKTKPPLTGHTSSVKCIDVSPNGKYLVSGSLDKTIKVWEISSQKEIKSLDIHRYGIDKVFFYNKKTIYSSAHCDFKSFDLTTGDENLSWIAPGNGAMKIKLNPNMNYLILAYQTYDESRFLKNKRRLIASFLEVVDLSTGKTIHTNTIFGRTWGPLFTDIDYSKKTNCIISSSNDRTLNVWDLNNNRKIKTLIGHSDEVNCVKISPNGNYAISGSANGEIIFWNLKSGIEIAKLIVLDERIDYKTRITEWAITTPNGLFDASSGAMKKMHYSAGLEIIELDQLKDRYYEPDLLKKLLSNDSTTIREVKSFNNVDLFPEIKLSEVEKDSKLNIALSNQGGGIGKVKVFINGKEISADARGENLDPYVDSLTLSLNIKDHPYLISDTNNKIEVKAYNAEGYLVSRGANVLYNPGGTRITEPTNLYILACGVSDYTGDQIDLNFAAKDAVDISNALEIGAHRLFGTDKTFIYELTTDNKNQNQWPTKENIKESFNKIASKAKSTDVIVVYLSGHGINWGGQDGDFYYLTQDAYTASADAYNDPAIRNSSTISSDTLVEWFKTVPALKQVLIIDACASGKLVKNLQESKDIASSTIRALERMKDRTGMHIITGCAADAVSYEASRYGQGVLTYSLIEGMKGASLREDEFADINLLFQHAVERVPQLAAGIGGIQEPEVFSPYGAKSFDIGLFTKQDKEHIYLAKIKPVFIQSTFLDGNKGRDILNLSNKLDEELTELASKGEKSELIFWDVDEYPEAYQLSGIYMQTDARISLPLNINYGEESEVILIEAESVEKLIESIIATINKKDADLN